MHQQGHGLFGGPPLLVRQLVAVTREFGVGGWEVLFFDARARGSAGTGIFSVLLPLLLVGDALPPAHGRLIDGLCKSEILFTAFSFHWRVYIY